MVTSNGLLMRLLTLSPYRLDCFAKSKSSFRKISVHFLFLTEIVERSAKRRPVPNFIEKRLAIEMNQIEPRPKRIKMDPIGKIEMKKIKTNSIQVDPIDSIEQNPIELNPIKTNPIKVKMEDLPELPFERILSELSLADRIRSRAVSKGWRKRFDSYPVRSLCYSERPSGRIYGKNRLISGVFAQNFVNCTRFDLFFNAYNRSILASLKHLRLCDLKLDQLWKASEFSPALNSFSQLEQLDIIRLTYNSIYKEIELNLPLLQSIHLERVYGIMEFALDAPGLQKIKLIGSPLRLHLVRGESVERLLTDSLSDVIPVEKMKNLRSLYLKGYQGIDPAFLSSLEQLKDVHVEYLSDTSVLFEQQRELGRTDLKIFFYGLLLDGPDDPTRYDYVGAKAFSRLVKNPSALADEIPFVDILYYTQIEPVAPELQANLLKLFTDLNGMIVDDRMQNIERFLELLKTFQNIVEVQFHCEQPQDLFDRLPDYCAVQRLILDSQPPLDLRFLWRLKNLTYLKMRCSADSETVRKLFEKLPYLSFLAFMQSTKNSQQEIRIKLDAQQRFEVEAGGEVEPFADLNAALHRIFRGAQ